MSLITLSRMYSYPSVYETSPLALSRVYPFPSSMRFIDFGHLGSSTLIWALSFIYTNFLVARHHIDDISTASRRQNRSKGDVHRATIAVQNNLITANSDKLPIIPSLICWMYTKISWRLNIDQPQIGFAFQC